MIFESGEVAVNFRALERRYRAGPGRACGICLVDSMG